jgi:hypothetical protein
VEVSACVHDGAVGPDDGRSGVATAKPVGQCAAGSRDVDNSASPFEQCALRVGRWRAGDQGEAVPEDAVDALPIG